MNYRYDNRTEYDLKDACRRYGFLVHPSFWRQSDGELLSIWNGIGAEGDWRNAFIPETVYGVNISLCSLPHDWGTYIGLSEEEFHINNLFMLYNANQIVRAESNNWITRNLRYLRTNKYYMAVESEDGWEAFRKGKEKFVSEGMFDISIANYESRITSHES